MEWVKFSFFSALAIGMLALLMAIFASHWFTMIFTLVFLVFYIWFALRFINYAHRFHVIENAMEMASEEIVQAPVCDQKSAEYAKFDKKIDKWIATKKFTENGISIDALAMEFGTNRHYLSTYFNSYKGKKFYDWISELKIEEAKKLMLQYPNMPLTKIAEKTGYKDKSHLISHFIKLTGISPTKWKQNIK